MYNLFGFVLVVIILQAAQKILGVDASFYFDEVALLLVIGGTFTAAVISFPPKYMMRLLKTPLHMLKNKSPKTASAIETLVRASNVGARGKSQMKSLISDSSVDAFLKEGVELLLLNLSREEFKNILTERIYRARQREEEWVNLFRRLSKYPPAFGLVGTVLGLVSLMRSVGEGANASQIGLNMALALVATLYGLGFANFVLAPIAEHFLQKADDQKVFRELLLEGLLMIFDHKSPLSVQEMLNSYLEPSERVDIVGIYSSESA